MEEHLITQDNDFFYGGRRIVQELKILNIEAKHADPALGTCNFCRIGRVVLVMLNCQCSQSKIQRLHPVHGFPFKNRFAAGNPLAQDDHEAIDHQRVLEALEACAELNAVEIRGDARKEWGV